MSAGAGDDVLVDDAGGRDAAVAAHFTGETGQLARAFLERRVQDERAPALRPADVAHFRQLAQRLADGDLAHVKARDQRVLRGQPVAGLPASGLDVAQDRGLQLVVEGELGSAALQDRHADRSHYNDMLFGRGY